MIKVIINGCNGKMGRVLQEIIAAEPEMEIAAGIDITENSSVTYPIFPSVAQCSCEADVVIDFTIAKIVDQLLDDCVEKKLPLVLCTTGLTPEQLAHVEEASKQIPIVQSYNMSLGINTLAKILESVAPTLADAGFDIEIIEKHHNQKIDAPSGTAKLLYDVIHEDIEETKEVYDRSTVHHKRERNEVGIQSVRAGTIFGEHSVLFAGHDEIIEVKHTALSKEVFVQGAISACLKIADKENGLFSLKNLY